MTIERVECSLDPEHLHSGELELPSAGWLDPTYSFPVQGWIVGKRQPVAAVEVVDHYGSRPHGLSLRMPVRLKTPDAPDSEKQRPWSRECGFASRINAVDLLQRFRVRLVARFPDGDCSPIAVIDGTRRPLPSREDTKFQPVMLTTLGRSGSTRLMTLLGKHPTIVVFEAQSNETRVASYFGDVLRTLSRPSSYVSALRGYAVTTQDWSGESPIHALFQYERDPQLRDWLGATYVEELIALVTHQVDVVYRRLSEHEGKPEATHFVEKTPPVGSQTMLAEIYPGAREILLVRDFRDYVCSARSYGSSWARLRSSFSSDEDWIRIGLASYVRDLLVYWRTRSESVFLVKYENLVSHTDETLASVFAHVGVDASSRTVSSIMGSPRKKSEEAAEQRHRTSAGPAESIGRWKKELDPALERACEEAFGEALVEFGYA